MQFSLSKSIEILSKTPEVLKTLLHDISTEWTSNTEGPDTWSPYDIIGHLIHGEETDWIPRAKIILQQVKEPFTPFDRFAQFQKSEGKSINDLLAEFSRLREHNLTILKDLNITEAQLALKGHHPALGEVTLKNLLATWTAHDLSHLSQISRVMAKQYKEEVGVWTRYMKIMQ